MAKGNMKLTSVKVDADVFEEFKVECLRDKFTLQKLVNASLLLYLNDEEFKKIIKNK
jgi:hypothetical protein